MQGKVILVIADARLAAPKLDGTPVEPQDSAICVAGVNGDR